MEIYNKNRLNPFYSLETKVVDDLIHQYINYLQNNVEITLELQERIHKFNRYFEYQKQLENIYEITSRRQLKQFTFEEQFYSDNIVKFIYESGNNKLKKYLHAQVKKSVIELINYTNKYQLKYVLKGQRNNERYKDYIINIELLDNNDYSVKGFIKKYKELFRINYMYQDMFMVKDAESKREFDYWYRKYYNMVWIDEDIKMPDLDEEVIRNNDCYYVSSMYI
jgi:hypothetical protein